MSEVSKKHDNKGKSGSKVGHSAKKNSSQNESKTGKTSQENKGSEKQAKSKLNVFKVNNYVLLGIALVSVACILVVLANQYEFFGKTVAVTVNGEDIPIKELNSEYQLYLKFVPSGSQGDFTKKMMLSYMVDETILMQSAKKAGITVTDTELEQYIDEMIKASSIPMTKKEFIRQIESNNLSYQKVREILYRKQFLIQKYLNATVLSKINITEDDVVQYYNQNYASSNVSIETLKPAIRQALYTKLQYDYYKILIQELKSKAVIENSIYADLTKFVKCLTQKGVVVYGIADDSRMRVQKQEIGDSAFQYLNYVECKDSSSGTLTEACSGILTYPAWKIGGTLRIGFKSVDSLSEATGCKFY